MAKRSGGRERRTGRSRRLPAVVKGLLVLAVIGGLAYGATFMAGVPYDDTDIAVVDFSGLSGGQKREALQAANRSRCPCGCGMNTAQCVATDSTCPLRDDNIKKIRGMVREAAGH